MEKTIYAKFDVLIVGAGPGGCTCALHLASTGLSIAIVDKGRFPRDKVCGDALSGTVKFELNKLPDDVLMGFTGFKEKADTWGIRFFAPNRAYIDIAFPQKYDDQAPGWISKRVDFDHFLVKQLEQHKNITLFEGFEVKEVAVNEAGARIISHDQTLEGKVVVGADGAQSVVARQLAGFKLDKDHFSGGLRVYYENVTGFAPGNLIELHFYRDLLPGYFWIFPLPGNQANVGIGMLSSAISKKRIDLKNKLKEIIESHPNIAPRFRNAKAIDEVRGFGLPLGSKKIRLSGRRFLLLGDAASLIDPFSGEGIGNAMTSGRLAAAQIAGCMEQDDFSAAAFLKYDESVYKKLWPELKVSHTMQRLLRYPLLFNLVVKKANRNAAVKKLLLNMFDDTDIKKELTRPSFYFRLLFS